MTTEQKQLNPKAKEFQPFIIPSPSKSLLQPPPSPPLLPPHFIWHGGWFLSGRPILPLKPIFTTYSYRNFSPPLLKPPSKTKDPAVDKTPAKPIRLRRRKLSRRRKEEVQNDGVPAGVGGCKYPFGSKTSLMIRNIPNRLSRAELMQMLDEHCCEMNSHDAVQPRSEFDFLYLPIDFKKKGNKGYAFVNMTTWVGAARLYESWNGTFWHGCRYSTRKICRFSPARFQGREALKKHFSTSVFRCESDEYLPVEISPPRNGSNAATSAVVSVGTRICR